ncbi:hypothetical protein [Planobispora longispora]|nr:hypothetical protein GCM10020093_117860 [Planobispora longispora]
MISTVRVYEAEGIGAQFERTGDASVGAHAQWFRLLGKIEKDINDHGAQTGSGLPQGL